MLNSTIINPIQLNVLLKETRVALVFYDLVTDKYLLEQDLSEQTEHVVFPWLPWI